MTGEKRQDTRNPTERNKGETEGKLMREEEMKNWFEGRKNRGGESVHRKYF